MICPNLKCGRTIVAEDSMRGKILRCAHCQQLFMVPVAEAVRRTDEPQPEKEPEKQSGRR